MKEKISDWEKEKLGADVVKPSVDPFKDW